MSPGGSSTVHIYIQTTHRTTQLTQTIHRTVQLTTRTTQLMFIYVELLGTTLMEKIINTHSILGNYFGKYIKVQLALQKKQTS